jgi:hypothetical protein
VERNVLGLMPVPTPFLAGPGGPAPLAGGESLGPADSPEAGVARWRRAHSVLEQQSWGIRDKQFLSLVGPNAAELGDLFPSGGLRRGSTVVVRGSTALLLALLAVTTAAGSWAVVVGMSDLGLLAAAEFGVVLHRLVLVPRPGAELGAVAAALLDGVDLVVVATDGITLFQARGANLARRLSARARHRGAVLLAFSSWPGGADLELSCSAVSWSGLGVGHGCLAGRRITVTARGRGAATRPRRAVLSLPGDGTVAAQEPVTEERAVG